MLRMLKRCAALMLLSALMLGGLPRASAKTVEEWLEGFETGETWFGEDFAYDITDEEACWELLQRPITVLDAGQREEIYPRVRDFIAQNEALSVVSERSASAA